MGEQSVVETALVDDPWRSAFGYAIRQNQRSIRLLARNVARREIIQGVLCPADRIQLAGCREFSANTLGDRPGGENADTLRRALFKLFVKYF